MAQAVAALRDILGRISIVLAAYELAAEEANKALEERAVYVLNHAIYTAIHDVLESIITELEASDGSSSDTGPHFVH